MKKVEDYIRTIPDFPEPGIMFRDVTSVLQDAEGFKLAIDEMKKLLDGVDFAAQNIIAFVKRELDIGLELHFINSRIIVLFKHCKLLQINF